MNGLDRIGIGDQVFIRQPGWKVRSWGNAETPHIPVSRIDDEPSYEVRKLLQLPLRGNIGLGEEESALGMRVVPSNDVSLQLAGQQFVRNHSDRTRWQPHSISLGREFGRR